MSALRLCFAREAGVVEVEDLVVGVVRTTDQGAGLDVADKRGTRGRLRNDAVPEPADPGFTDVEDAVESLLTDARAGQDVESTRDRIVRQCYGTLLAAGIDTEDAAFPSAVAKGLQRR